MISGGNAPSYLVENGKFLEEQESLLINENGLIRRRLTAISPSSFVHRIQGAPRPVMINLGTVTVSHSFVAERDAATLATCCFLRARSWRWYH